MFARYIPSHPHRFGTRSDQPSEIFAERLQWLVARCRGAGRAPSNASAMKAIGFLLLTISLSFGASAQVAAKKPAPHS